ncbi:MAG TPA: EAL domain-containing protein [Acidimicrobiales bacterium]|nr:EAL domain-containing protein [Acidimicrobiales bacterium]
MPENPGIHVFSPSVDVARPFQGRRELSSIFVHRVCGIRNGRRPGLYANRDKQALQHRVKVVIQSLTVTIISISLASVTVMGIGVGRAFANSVPRVSDVSPTYGPTTEGTPITVTGSGFDIGETVRFGIASSSMTVSSSTSIFAVTPANTAGTVGVVDTDTARSGTGTNIFPYGTSPSITGMTITGTPSVSQVHNASASGATGDPAPLASYLWMRDGIPISGAMISTYIASSADVRSSITTKITETNGVDAAASATSGSVAIPFLPSSLQVTTTSSSSAHGSSVAFTATVSPSTATGTATFKRGSSVLGSCTLSLGRCKFATASLPGGSDTITASYQPSTSDSAKYTSATSNSRVALVLVSIPSVTSATHQFSASALGNPTLGGFASSSAATVEAIGVRTVFSFDLSSGSIGDASRSLAKSASAPQRAARFAQAVSAVVMSNLAAQNYAGVHRAEDAAVMKYLSLSGRQPPGMVNSYFGTKGHRWVEITAQVSSYTPGTIAFRAVTTRPLVFADAAIGEDGTAVLGAVFPVDAVGAGIHHIRVLGERVLDAVVANSKCQIVVRSSAIAAIHQFDVQTKATVSIRGMPANNKTLTLVRAVLPGAGTSWWTLLFPIVPLLAALLAVVLGWVRRRRIRVLLNAVIFGGSIVPIVTGWSEGVSALVHAGFEIGFGAIVLVQLLPNLANGRVVDVRSQLSGYRIARPGDRLTGRNFSEEDEMGSDCSPHRRGSTWWRWIEPRIGSRSTRPIGASAAQLEVVRFSRERTRPRASKQRHGRGARYDKLAGPPHQTLFLERVVQAVGRARGDDSKLAVLYINLDGFRLFNDAKGKDSGDVLLQVVADRLRATIADEDVLAHLAADEYAILCEHVVDEADAQSRAEQILKAFKRPFMLAGSEATVSASIGIALGDQHVSPAALVEDAEIALHTAKQVGRGGIRIYDDGIRELAEYRYSLDGALHHALARDELFLTYQPIASLQARRYVGVEALLRWRHPELGVIGPEEFIPVAEENGLIIPIGTWVLERACEQLRRWRDASPEAASWRMSVNTAALQLGALDFPDVIERSLENSGLMASDLRIELTESALIESGVATDVLRRLRELGVRIAIDDFGTKYSSLSYLTRLPIDELKIDESFISGLVGDESMQAIVSAILTIGRSLGLTVTAEGVETEAQLIELLMLGCDSVQGYLFEKPLLPDECFTTLLSMPRPPLGRK